VVGEVGDLEAGALALGHHRDRVRGAQRRFRGLTTARPARWQVRSPEVEDIRLGVRPYVLDQDPLGVLARRLARRERAEVLCPQELRQQMAAMLDCHSPLPSQLYRTSPALAPGRLGRRARRLTLRADVDEQGVEAISRRPRDPGVRVVEERPLAEHQAAAG
jgi:hypothetical protein